MKELILFDYLLKPVFCVAFFLLFLTTYFYLSNAKESLATELVSESVRSESFIDSMSAYRYLQDSRNATSAVDDKESSFALIKLLNGKASVMLVQRLNKSKTTNNLQAISQLKQAKDNLANNEQVDRAFIDQWIVNLLANEAANQFIDYSSSNNNTAGAIVITNPRWAIPLVLALILLSISSFLLGLIVAEIRQKKVSC